MSVANILRQPLSPSQASQNFPPLWPKSPVKSLVSRDFADLAGIYQHNINLCLIERPFPGNIEQFVYAALAGKFSVETSLQIDPLCFDFGAIWPRVSGLPGYHAWLDDVQMLVGAFCDLFELREAGLRLYTLDKTMCPRFHVDRVPARLICSYGGIGTEWLPEYGVDRTKLGMGAGGRPDDQSGLILDPTAIRQMPAYAVGLMKGEHWEGNEGHGLVHRSPALTAVRPRRLLLTLDML